MSSSLYQPHSTKYKITSYTFFFQFIYHADQIMTQDSIISSITGFLPRFTNSEVEKHRLIENLQLESEQFGTRFDYHEIDESGFKHKTTPNSSLTQN